MMAIGTLAFFKKHWKSVLFSILALLLIVIYYTFFWPILVPVPSTNTWLENGNLVIFCGSVLTSPLTQDNGLFFIDVRNKEMVRWEPTTIGSHDCGAVEWISQKEQLQFNGTINSVYGLYILDKKGKVTKQIDIDTFVPHSSMDYVMSSDGQDIAFVYKEDIYVQNIENSSRQRLIHDAYINREPDWSPDNQSLVFRTYRQDEDLSTIGIIDRDGTNLIILAQSENSLNTPKWSPNGEMIAFKEFNEGHRNTLWTMNADGTNVRRILIPNKGSDTVEDFVWLSDSTHILFLSSRDEVCIVSVYPRTCTKSLYQINIYTGEVTSFIQKWLFSANLALIE
jgi:hypothetical protein